MTKKTKKHKTNHKSIKKIADAIGVMPDEVELTKRTITLGNKKRKLAVIIKNSKVIAEEG